MLGRDLPTDPLSKYSARDLLTALHWTSKQDLVSALGEEQSELWLNLIEADRNLPKFYPDQLAKVIEHCSLLKQ